jgi:hypothetical protein
MVHNERWERGELGDGNTHSWWSLKDSLEISHSLVGAVDTERAFYFGRYEGGGNPK